MLTNAGFITRLRDRINDYEATPMFTDAELQRHVDQVIREFSWYRPYRKTHTYTVVALQTHYFLPDDCVIVQELRDDATNLLSGWRQDDQYLVVNADAVANFATIEITYGGTHDASNGSYTTIQTLYESDILDLMEARCLELMATDFGKRSGFSEAETKLSYQDTSSMWIKRAVALRWRVQMKYAQIGASIG